MRQNVLNAGGLNNDSEQRRRLERDSLVETVRTHYSCSRSSFMYINRDMKRF